MVYAYSLMREKVVAFEVLVFKSKSSASDSNSADAQNTVNGQLVLQGIGASSFSVPKQDAVRSALAAVTSVSKPEVQLLPVTDEGKGNTLVRFQIKSGSASRHSTIKTVLTDAQFSAQFTKMLKEQAVKSHHNK